MSLPQQANGYFYSFYPSANRFLTIKTEKSDIISVLCYRSRAIVFLKQSLHFNGFTRSQKLGLLWSPLVSDMNNCYLS